MATQDSDAGSPALPTSLDLHILSPSAGVPQPLLLRGIPTNTTVRQLKERLRSGLEAKPADNAQRLIHRGRLLARDEDTLLDVFGEEAVRSAERQTLHLVLREVSDAPAAAVPNSPAQHVGTDSIPPPGHATAQPPPPPPAQPAVAENGQPQPHITHIVHNLAPQPNNPFGFAPQVQVRIGAFPQPQVHFVPPMGQPANLPPGYTQQQFAQHQLQWMAAMNAQMGQRRMEELMNQQRDRGTPGAPNTTQEAVNPATQGGAAPASSIRTASPFQQEATRTVLREGVGPNGQPWRVVVNEPVPNPLMRTGRTGSPFAGPDMPNMFRPPAPSSHPQQPRSVPSGGPLNGNDLQSILQQGDANQATRTMTDAMRRNASTSSLATLGSNHSAQPIPPGVTVPSRTGSATGTPDPLRAAGFARAAFPFQPPPPPQPATNARNPEVYILSSPSGPRALLVNSDQHTYFTPQGRAGLQGAFGNISMPGLFPPLQNHGLIYNSPLQIPTPQQPMNPFHGAAVGTPASPSPQVNNGQGQEPGGLPAPPQGAAQADNIVVARPEIAQPVVQARELRMVPIWPHVWMIIRLVLFVWWFTSPDSSWSRWITVLSIAVALFLANTGVLNPLVEQFWVPIRGHIENLMPLADNHGRVQPQQRAAGADGGNTGTNQEPDPADTAARLVQQRRDANAHWLLNAVRRLERAGLIFLASIAPGIAERHIEHLEAEARAERQRAEAEAAAAAAAAAAQAATQDNSENSEEAQTSAETAAAESEPGSAGGAGASGDFEAAATGTGEIRQRQVQGTTDG